VNKILVFRMFLSENCKTLFWRWFCSFQLERAIPNCINRTIEDDFEKAFSDAKHTSTILAPQNRLCKSCNERH